MLRRWTAWARANSSSSSIPERPNRRLGRLACRVDAESQACASGHGRCGQARSVDPGLLDIRDAHIAFRDLLLPEPFLGTFAELHLEHRREEVLAAHGLAPRRTLLLTGPPGTGKSATAEALADEMGRDFAIVNLATVVSSLLGDTARNLATIFEAAAAEPLVLLFDEFDAIARERAEQSDHGERSAADALRRRPGPVRSGD